MAVRTVESLWRPVEQRGADCEDVIAVEAAPSWRVFPERVAVQELLGLGDQALEAGNLIAAGNWYFHAKRRGSAVGRDKARALQPQLEVLANNGDVDAKVLVAGLLLERDEQLPRAVSLLEEAAAAGVVEGMRELGFVLAAGVGVIPNPTKANQLYRAAADAGDGYAAYNLAVNFYRGHGTGKSFREFSKWLQLAANQGIPEACALLGDQCARRDLEGEALRWYVRAASSSHVPAMLVAARYYRDGIGVSTDPVQALRWFLTPLDRGNGDGIHEAIELAALMTSEQIIEAGRISGRVAEAESLLHRN